MGTAKGTNEIITYVAVWNQCLVVARYGRGNSIYVVVVAKLDGLFR